MRKTFPGSLGEGILQHQHKLSKLFQSRRLLTEKKRTGGDFQLTSAPMSLAASALLRPYCQPPHEHTPQTCASAQTWPAQPVQVKLGQVKCQVLLHTDNTPNISSMVIATHMKHAIPGPFFHQMRCFVIEGILQSMVTTSTIRQQKHTECWQSCSHKRSSNGNFDVSVGPQRPAEHITSLYQEGRDKR